MSFADELRGISQSNKEKLTTPDQIVTKTEKSFPLFIELFYTCLKGECLVNANSGRTSLLRIPVSRFFKQAVDTDPRHTFFLFSSIFIPEEGRRRPYTSEEQELVRAVRWYLCRLLRDRNDNVHYCLQERYAAFLASEITARFQAEGLQAGSSLLDCGQGCCDVEFNISW